ncbi:histidine phosphatase family protein [Spongiibacter sp. KMU-158]|uniref:Histidine phosphatase family protein n=1 Tax=Spongiibacter pelagi TaxID=2760804 RepID=A0A927BZM7_9GAMM|nr:histidine phosphatase family protein [Spongiibacter pelagi]MBD2857483.1 histidine phosphatase family protein [Spongiibacter pelagi]
MPRLIAALIRHGDYHQLADTPSAHQPFPLNEKGLAQAQSGGQRIKNLVDELGLTLHPEIDTSLLQRAWQTAEQIQQVLDPGQQDTQLCGFAELAERSVGSAANLSTHAIAAIIDQDPRYPSLPKDWKSNSHFRLPFIGAESLMESGQRVATHLQTRMAELETQISTDTVKLFIGHGAAFRHAAHILGALAFEDIAKLSMYHAEPVLLEYSRNGDWQHIGGKWKIRDKHSAYKD